MCISLRSFTALKGKQALRALVTDGRYIHTYIHSLNIISWLHKHRARPIGFVWQTELCTYVCTTTTLSPSWYFKIIPHGELLSTSSVVVVARENVSSPISPPPHNPQVDFLYENCTETRGRREKRAAILPSLRKKDDWFKKLCKDVQEIEEERK